MPIFPIILIQVGVVFPILLIYDIEVFVYGLGLLGVYAAFDIGLLLYVRRGGTLEKVGVYAALCAAQFIILGLFALGRHVKMIWTGGLP